MKAKAAAKAPEKINPLTEYLVNESTRQGGSPDAKTDAQIRFLMAEDEAQETADQEPPKASPLAKRRKPAPKTKSRGKKKR